MLVWCQLRIVFVSRSPTLERYREVTPGRQRQRRFSPSSDDVIGGERDRRNLIRPRSLVLENVETFVDASAFDGNVVVARPMKKYKSVVVLRETANTPPRQSIQTETNRF